MSTTPSGLSSLLPAVAVRRPGERHQVPTATDTAPCDRRGAGNVPVLTHAACRRLDGRSSAAAATCSVIAVRPRRRGHPPSRSSCLRTRSPPRTAAMVHLDRQGVVARADPWSVSPCAWRADEGPCPPGCTKHHLHQASPCRSRWLADRTWPIHQGAVAVRHLQHRAYPPLFTRPWSPAASSTPCAAPSEDDHRRTQGGAAVRLTGNWPRPGDPRP